MKSAIVVGAGLAGLTAAYRLKQAGWQVKVLEAAHEVGGRAVSLTKQGYTIDTGAVGLGTVYKDFMDLCEELGIKSHLRPSSTVAATARGGKIYEIDSAKPITGLTSKLLSFGSKLKMVTLMRDLGKVRPHLNIRDVAAAAEFDTETAEAYARRRLNPELLEYFIEPLARTVNLSRANRVSILEVFNSLAGLFSTQLVHFPEGIGVVSNTMAKQLDVRLNTPVTAIKRFDDHVEVSYAGTTESADVCVIATTLPQAMDIFPEARTLLAPLSNVIQYNRGLDVHLGYKAATRTKALMVMMPPSEQKEIALFFLEHNKAPNRAPDGHSLITIFFDHHAADRPWALDDDTLCKECAAIVERYLPELAGKLEMTQVTRWPLGLTNPDKGIYKAMQEVNRKLNPADRVQFVGDYRSTAGQNSAVVWGNNVARDVIKNFA